MIFSGSATIVAPSLDFRQNEASVTQGSLSTHSNQLLARVGVGNKDRWCDLTERDRVVADSKRTGENFRVIVTRFEEKKNIVGMLLLIKSVDDLAIETSMVFEGMKENKWKPLIVIFYKIVCSTVVTIMIWYRGGKRLYEMHCGSVGCSFTLLPIHDLLERPSFTLATG